VIGEGDQQTTRLVIPRQLLKGDGSLERQDFGGDFRALARAATLIENQAARRGRDDSRLLFPHMGSAMD